MKVRELIALLLQQDQEAKVYTPGTEDGTVVLFDVEGISPATSEILGSAVLLEMEV